MSITATRHQDIDCGHRVPEQGNGENILGKVGKGTTRPFGIVKGRVKQVYSGAGVYALQNTRDNKSYVGSSRNIPKRVAEHINLLRRGKHGSPLLQNAWNKYGEQNFAVLILSHCSINEEELLEEEQIYIESMGDYNLSPASRPGRRLHTLEERLAASTRAKGRPSPLKGKTYKEIYGDQKPMCGFQKGVPISQEARTKISAATKRMWEEGRLKGRPKKRPPLHRCACGCGRFFIDRNKKFFSHQCFVNSVRGKTLKERFGHDYVFPTKGKPKSEETKARMKQAWIKRRQQ